MTIQIVIDVTGEAAGTPGAAREFAYTKVSPTPPTATVSLDDNTGITSYLWEFLAQPVGASASFSDDEAAAPTFTPTASVSGTYLIKCTVNGGTDSDINALAFSTQNLALRKPAPGETTEFDASRGWAVANSLMMDTVDDLSTLIGSRRRAVINVHDNTQIPLTENEGDRYLLDNTGTSHTNWDGAAANSIVQFDGTVWVEETPIEGWIVYVDALNKDYRYVDDGVGQWEAAGLAYQPTTVSNAGNPNGVVSGNVNEMCWDTTNKVLYINHDGATGWYVV